MAVAFFRPRGALGRAGLLLRATSSLSQPDVVDFENTAVAFSHLGTRKLVMKYLVLRGCTIPAIGSKADKIFSASNRLLGSRFTSFAMRHTVFPVFCGGESSKDLQSTLKQLSSFNIGAILDYAAESSPELESDTAGSTLDANAATILESIEVASGAGNPIAIKLSAVQEPLKVCSTALRQVENAFRDGLEVAGGDLVPAMTTRRERFLASLKERATQFGGNFAAETCDVFLSNSSDADRATLSECLSFFSPGVLFRIFFPKDAPSLEQSWSEGEGRINEILEHAKAHDVRILVDAEHQCLQPAIDWLALAAMERFNTSDHALVSNTYQAYLKDSFVRLRADLARVTGTGVRFGAKLVRGAYLSFERKSAQEEGRPDPICSTLAATTASYDRCTALLLDNYGTADSLFGTHNETSVQMIISTVWKITESLDPSGDLVWPTRSISIAQLLGMADNITFNAAEVVKPLAPTDTRDVPQQPFCYKYVPYGPIQTVLPYLLRRVEENSSVLGSAVRELPLMRKEIGRRFGFFWAT
eukprot:Polyplicarium_translucidae@DN3379_c3_g1_i10.p1